MSNFSRMYKLHELKSQLKSQLKVSKAEIHGTSNRKDSKNFIKL